MRLPLLILVSLSLPAAEYWVSPTGNDSNAGTFDAPWTLAKVCRATAGATPIAAVSAGDTVWFRGGTYMISAQPYCDLVGTSGSHITLRTVPGEVAKLYSTIQGIDKQLVISGSYIYIIGNFFVQFAGSRIEKMGGSNPLLEVPNGIYVGAASLGPPTGNRIINTWNTGNGGTVSATSGDYGTTYYGTINFDQGSDGPDRLHGGWMYQQNNVSNGTETAKHNVSLDQPWYYNFRIYTAGGTTTGIVHDGQIVVGGNNFINTPAIGAEIKNSFMVIDDNFTFSRPVGATQSLVFNNNKMLIERGFLDNASDLRGMTITNNAIADSVADTSDLLPTTAAGEFFPTMGGNTLHKATGSYMRCLSEAVTSGSIVHWTPANWATWLGYGYDSGSTCTAGSPAANWVSTYANEYESGRANIAVYNWTGATTQSVDVSSFLAAGDRWEAIDLWTPLSAPVASGTLTGSTISLPLTGVDYYTPWGNGTAGNTARPRACWETDRANCLTSGDYTVAATAGALPAGTTLYQAGLLSSNYAVYYWNGSAWTSAGVTMATHAGPTYAREANTHVFLIRRVYDSRAYTTVAWRGDTSGLRAGYKKPDGSYSWELPVIGAACADGLCSAKVPQAVGDAWIEVGGTPMKMRAQ
jgi:hypothetical protein